VVGRIDMTELEQKLLERTARLEGTLETISIVMMHQPNEKMHHRQILSNAKRMIYFKAR
jgi:hypothetical protein